VMPSSWVFLGVEFAAVILIGLVGVEKVSRCRVCRGGRW
jgi:hypothetical protein